MAHVSTRRAFTTTLHTRNGSLTCVALFFIVLAVLSLPVPLWPFNLFTPESEATFQFTWQPMAPRNNFTVSDAYIDIYGKGGLSANNPLTISLTWYINGRTIFDQGIGYHFEKPILRPHGAYSIDPWTKQVIRDKRGFPQFANITLTRQEAKNDVEKWTGSQEVIYYQGGIEWGFEIILDNKYKLPFPNSVHIGTEDVTVASRTNAVVTSLTLIVLSFSCLELRSEKKQDPAKKNSRQYNVAH